MKSIFFLHCVFFSIVFSQTDTMVVKMNDGSIKNYLVPEISSISFTSPLTYVDHNAAQRILTSFSMRQNYPNPFNPATTIEYSIPAPGNIEVRIYDIQGRLVNTLEQTRKEAGNYRIMWNGRSAAGLPAASGTYFCRVDFNGNMLVKKLALIK